LNIWFKLGEGLLKSLDIFINGQFILKDVFFIALLI